MKAKDVVGKKIASVSQDRGWDTENERWIVSINSIRLEDGTRIVFHAVETVDTPVVEASVIKPRKGT